MNVIHHICCYINVSLFSFGELRWYPNIPHVIICARQTYVIQMEYFSFHLHQKINEYSTILRVGKLFHEFIVDVWAIIEQVWLCWVGMN